MPRAGCTFRDPEGIADPDTEPGWPDARDKSLRWAIQRSHHARPSAKCFRARCGWSAHEEADQVHKALRDGAIGPWKCCDANLSPLRRTSGNTNRRAYKYWGLQSKLV